MFLKFHLYVVDSDPETYLRAYSAKL